MFVKCRACNNIISNIYCFSRKCVRIRNFTFCSSLVKKAFLLCRLVNSSLAILCMANKQTLHWKLTINSQRKQRCHTKFNMHLYGLYVCELLSYFSFSFSVYSRYGNLLLMISFWTGSPFILFLYHKHLLYWYMSGGWLVISVRTILRYW